MYNVEGTEFPGSDGRVIPFCSLEPDNFNTFVSSPQNSSFSVLEIRSKVFWASSGFFVQASSSTWNMRTGIVTAEANSWEFISGAVYAPILINSKSMSSKYWLIPWSSENPRFFHFKVSI
jgi:hypothetical protein